MGGGECVAEVNGCRFAGDGALMLCGGGRLVNSRLPRRRPPSSETAPEELEEAMPRPQSSDSEVADAAPG